MRTPLLFPLGWLAVVMAIGTSIRAADSGPVAGSAVVQFQVFNATGDHAGEVLDIVAHREGQPTLYCFVPAERWDRPTARLLRHLDQSIGETADKGAVVVVWVTSDTAAAREYLPRAQQSLKFSRTSLTVYEAGPTGPGEWGINTDVSLTVVASNAGRVLRSFVLDSPSDTDAPEILGTLK